MIPEQPKFLGRIKRLFQMKVLYLKLVCHLSALWFFTCLDFLSLNFVGDRVGIQQLWCKAVERSKWSYVCKWMNLKDIVLSKPGTKRQVLYDYTFMRCNSTSEVRETECRMVVARAWGRGTGDSVQQL